MLKGKSLIQLFDAVNGRETSRLESHNMITNAVTRLLNPPARWGTAGQYSNLSAAANMITPAAQRALGGILLWEDAITEDANNIMPPAGNVLVGNAGGAYSGTAAKRGSYNAAESGATEGGYRHVWDFATDRANGTVNCITLTSLNGGNTGLVPDSEGNGPFCYPFGFGGAPTVMGASRIYPASLIAQGVNAAANLTKCGARLSGERYLFCTKVGSIYTMYLMQAPASTALTLTTDFSGGGTAGKIISSYVLTGYPLSFTVLDGEYFAYINTYGVYTCEIKKCRILTGEVVQTISLNVTGSGSTLNLSQCADTKAAQQLAFHNGFWYLADGQAIYRFNEAGTILARIPTGAYGVWHNLSVFGGNLYATCPGTAANGAYQLLVNDDDTVTAFKLRTDSGFPKFPIYDAAPYYPFVLCTAAESDQISVPPEIGPLDMMIYGAYLGSINNLDVPVVKTAAQTMKITYELYDE